LKQIQFWKQRVTEFLFPTESDSWLSLLRFGLGLQLIFYCFSIRGDWNYLLSGRGGFLSRNFSEALLSLESAAVPRLGWLVTIGSHFGLGEAAVLSFAWYVLIVAGCLLLVGLFSRQAAIAGWVVHLGAIKSAALMSYGVDNLTTIGLFYLMLSPLPDRYSLDSIYRKFPSQDRHLLGFWRRVLQVHLCLIYFFGGIAKCVGTGWWNGTNLWRALIRPPFNVISAQTLVHFKYLFPPLGIAIFVLELGYPFFVWNRRLGRPWLLAILLMHVGIGVTMGMYLFASVMIFLNLAAFGPGILWPDEGKGGDQSRFSPVGAPND
jgi:hypothetical protein